MIRVVGTIAAPARAAIAHACTHCGLPVPNGLVNHGATQQFCCGGCHAVYESLYACGLEKYYEIAVKESRVRDARPAYVTRRRFAHLDRPEFTARHATTADASRLSVELRIDGMRCGACVWLLEALPRIVHGLIAVRVNIGRGAVAIDWDPAQITLAAIAQRCDALGYQLLQLADPDARGRERAIDRSWLIRIGVAAAIASNSMAVAFALYGGLLSSMDARFRLFFQWIAVVLAVASLAGPGRLFFANAIAAIRTRTPHMDLPVATGLLGAVVAGLVSTVTGNGSIYCESATMLVFLLLVGRFVQYRQQRRAHQEVELITSLVPALARKREGDGSVVDVPIESLVIGDIVEVAAGETVPCDGQLRSPAARFDCSMLTGESRLSSIAANEPVFAGTRPVDRPVAVMVEKAGAETRAGQLLARVAEASARRPPIVELANRMAGWFLLAVLTGAAATTLWWWHLGADVAIARAVALLVVTCPCALGLATPLAVVVGIGKAARKGVLVKGGDVLERVSTRGTIVLDKTGTLTEGRVAVTCSQGDPAALVLAASLECSSVHPIARAIADAFGAASHAASRDVREHLGHGIEGVVERQHVAVGSARLIHQLAITLPAWTSDAADSIVRRGESPVFVAVDREVRALVAVGDPVRAEAAATIARLRSFGWSLAMASGDHPVVAHAVGAAVGLQPHEIEGGCSPERKVQIVRDSQFAAPVVMVGDGVNDLAAMAAADIGVAMRNGAQSALHVADACLAGGGLTPLLRLVEGARRTMHAIRLNLAVSIAYNTAGGVLAFLGFVNPLVAAVLMPVSSLTVMAIALAMPSFSLAADRADQERS